MQNRRTFLRAATHGGAAALALQLGTSQAADKEKPVTASEDLMREHGVLRRALLVYQEASERLVQGRSVPAPALARTAQLFRTFGEDYHEVRLEEKLVFPAVGGLKGPVARLPDILKMQHAVGRQLTDYVSGVTRSGQVQTVDINPLAKALHQFVIMYQHHAAIEDTVVFPAWKQSLPEKAYSDMGEQFERIEQQMFGHDGFEDAVKRIAAIEHEFGLADLAALTMPAPPRPPKG
jgi:hemerythrin-like domain-containing protein